MVKLALSKQTVLCLLNTQTIKPTNGDRLGIDVSKQHSFSGGKHGRESKSVLERVVLNATQDGSKGFSVVCAGRFHKVLHSTHVLTLPFDRY